MASNNNDSTEYNGEDIQRYVNGQMSAREMHAMEKAALEDPFLADAIEGYKETLDAGESNITPHLAQLHLRLKARVQKKERKHVVIGLAWWRIAAVFILLAGCGALAYRLLNHSSENRESPMAKNESTVSTDSSAKQNASAKTFTTVDSTSVALNNKTPEAKREDVFPLKAKTKSASPNVTNQSDPVASPPSLMQITDSSITRSPERDIASSPTTKRELDKSATVEKKMAMRSLAKEMPVNLFSGKVVSEENKPVPRASVRILGKNEMQWATDSNGYFKFSLPDTVASVVVDAVGFATTKTTINSNLTDSRIRLRESKDALNDVVVIGYGKNKINKTSAPMGTNSAAAEPEMGFAEYFKYIETNKRTDTVLNQVHGNVVVSFFVDTEGRLSKFKIEKSLSKSIDKEAIRLLKEGPAWKVLNGKKTKAEFAIRF